MKLCIDLRSQWIAGTGRGQGSALDALTRRDPLGLPMYPGRSLRGLLRDAVGQASALGWYGEEAATSEQLTTRLFGDWSGGTADRAPEDVRPGCLAVSDARLPEAFRQWVASIPDTEERLAITSSFFASHHSTSIDSGTGVARSGSLRGMEVAQPLTLEADISLLGDPKQAPPQWEHILQTALPLIRSIGGKRHRGFGRASLSLITGAAA